MRHAAALAISTLAFSCVPKKKHDEGLAREAMLRDALSEVTSDRDDQVARAGDLEAALRAARTRASELDALALGLEKRNEMLGIALDDLSAKVQELSAADRRARAQKAEMEAMLATVQAAGAQAEAEAATARTRIARMEAEAQQLAAEKATLEQKTGEHDALVAALQGQIEAGQITITELSGKLTVQMSNAILFDSGSMAVKQTGRDALVTVAAVLRSVDDREIQVEGHTDDDPVRPGATYPDNWALSALRARTVLTILVENGVSEDNLAIVGYGEHRPVDDNETPEGKAANRRTEIVLIPRLEKR